MQFEHYSNYNKMYVLQMLIWSRSRSRGRVSPRDPECSLGARLDSWTASGLYTESVVIFTRITLLGARRTGMQFDSSGSSECTVQDRGTVQIYTVVFIFRVGILLTIEICFQLRISTCFRDSYFGLHHYRVAPSAPITCNHLLQHYSTAT